MKGIKEKNTLAKVLASVAIASLSEAANGRCAYVYHQPKHPESVKKYRKF